MSTFQVEETPEYKHGKKYELIAQEIIKQVNSVSVVEHDGTPGRQNHAEYDFRTSDNITYEVKGDEQSTKYGNFFIAYCQEINNVWRNAGIRTTKANYHMLLHGQTFYTIKTEALEKLINSKTKVSKYVNDRGNTVKGFCIPVKDVKPCATIYEHPDLTRLWVNRDFID